MAWHIAQHIADSISRAATVELHGFLIEQSDRLSMEQPAQQGLGIKSQQLVTLQGLGERDAVLPRFHVWLSVS